MKTILFIYPHLSTFIKKDIEILSKKYKIIEYHFNPSRKFLTPIELIIQFLYILWHNKKIDIYYSTFAAYHTLVPSILSRLFNKKSIIVVGGTDAHKFPEFKYGNFSKKLLGLFTCLSFKYCSLILPKHSSLIKSDYIYMNVLFGKQGFKNWCAGLTTRCLVVENGYDSAVWYNTNKGKLKNTFLTVGSGLESEREFFRKGIDLIVELAKKFKELKFIIVGAGSLPFGIHESNIELIDHIANQYLIEYYSKSEFYLQLSYAEGFPNSLCESMLCECIPIGTDCFGIPDIIGDTGYILKTKNIDDLFNIVELAIKKDQIKNGRPARQRIESRYSMAQREAKLMEALTQ